MGSSDAEPVERRLLLEASEPEVVFFGKGEPFGYMMLKHGCMAVCSFFGFSVVCKHPAGRVPTSVKLLRRAY